MNEQEYLVHTVLKNNLCKDSFSYYVKHSFSNLRRFDFKNVRVLPTQSNLYKCLFLEMAHTEKNKHNTANVRTDTDN